MSDKEHSPSVEDTEKAGNKEYFSYETGMFYLEKERKNAIDKRGSVKGQFSYYEFGRDYLTYVGKNTVRAADPNDTHRPFYAEDLIKHKYHYLTINQLKRRISKLLDELALRGVEVMELTFRSEEIKKAKSKKKAPKGFDDLVSEMGSFPGVITTKSAVKKATKNVRADSVANREAYNDKNLLTLIHTGEVSIGKKSYKAKIKDPKTCLSRESFLEQFSGNKRGEFQDIHEEGYVSSPDIYAVFVQKQGRVSGLNKDEFYAWLTKFYNSRTKTAS